MKDTTYFPQKLGKRKALEYMSNNKGRFFTATFIDKDGKQRTINCQYLKYQAETVLGYVKVREAIKMKAGENSIRQINLQTLVSLFIAKQKYHIM